MLRCFFLFACLLGSGLTLRAQQAQTKSEFGAYCAAFFPKVQALSTDKQYGQILTRYAEWEEAYKALAPDIRQEFRGALASVNYNRACYYALLKDRRNAVLSFQRAVEAGYRMLFCFNRTYALERAWY